jgi:hypothetical protein
MGLCHLPSASALLREASQSVYTHLLIWEQLLRHLQSGYNDAYRLSMLV